MHLSGGSTSLIHAKPQAPTTTHSVFVKRAFPFLCPSYAHDGFLEFVMHDLRRPTLAVERKQTLFGIAIREKVKLKDASLVLGLGRNEHELNTECTS